MLIGYARTSTLEQNAGLEAQLETKLDRLARSVRHLMEITERLRTRAANLRVLSLNVDTGTATGRLMFNMIGAVAEFEREMMLERQREGIARAKAEGKYKGRKATARSKAHEVKELRARGLGASEIARTLGISRASVYRVLDKLPARHSDHQGH